VRFLECLPWIIQGGRGRVKTPNVDFKAKTRNAPANFFFIRRSGPQVWHICFPEFFGRWNPLNKNSKTNGIVLCGYISAGKIELVIPSWQNDALSTKWKDLNGGDPHFRRWGGQPRGCRSIHRWINFSSLIEQMWCRKHRKSHKKSFDPYIWHSWGQQP